MFRELIDAVGWVPLIVATLILGVPLLCSVIYSIILMIRAVARSGGQIKTPIFTLTIPTPNSPNFPLKAVTERRSIGRRATPLAAELRRFRQKRKVSQGDLANLLNVSVAFISRVEAGTEMLGQEQLERIIVEFGLGIREATKLRDALTQSARKRK